MFKNNGYQLIKRLGIIFQDRQQGRTKGRMGNLSLRLAGGMMVVGLLCGVCGPLQPHSVLPFTSFFLVAPVEATGQPQADLSESAPIPLLNAWPEVVDEASKEPVPSPVRKRIVERPLPGLVRKASPGTTTPLDQTPAALLSETGSSAKVVLASLLTSTDSIPVSASETTSPASEEEGIAGHDIEEETPVEGDIPADESEEGATFEEETPVYTEEELQNLHGDQSAVTPPAAPEASPSVAPAPAPVAPPEKKSGKKGYVIRVEGDDLVVYDAQGNEIYRKGKSQSRSSSHLSKIKGAASKLEEEIAQPEAAVTAPAETTPPATGGDLVFHEVKRGENPSIIARQYPGLTAQKLMEANKIANPASIQIGTKLWIPNVTQGVTHVVQAGETLSDLLKKYEVNNLFEVCDVNGLSRDTNEVAPGTVLVIPGAKPKPQAVAKKRPTAITIDPSTFTGRAGWTWPVEGEVELSSPYGLRIDPFSVLKKKPGVAAGGGKDGVKRSFHHGIDLSMPVGTPVKAARDGEIMKVSISRWGHGRMVQILHEDGWSTVYSHNSRILVKVGDRVKQGDVIALSGSTGRSTGPHLHFEVRRPDQKSVDPRRFLSAIE